MLQKRISLMLKKKTGVYILTSQKNSSPPLKFFPVFVDFLRYLSFIKVFQRVFYQSFLFFFFSPLFLSFFQVLLQILPCFSLWTKIYIPVTMFVYLVHQILFFNLDTNLARIYFHIYLEEMH